MTIDHDAMKELYLQHGFVWSPHLEEFVREHLGGIRPYLHHKTGALVQARFCRAELVKLGRESSQYLAAIKYLGVEVAPVGDCHRSYIELLLTGDGRLVGVADYLLLRWGGAGDPWRRSLELLFSGAEPAHIGVMDSD